MKIEEIKQKMINWEDFYGADISNTSGISKARTKKQLKEILEHHRRYMEDTLCDACRDLDQFEKELGL